MNYAAFISSNTIINEHIPPAKLNVFLCFDDNYSLQAGVTVTSLLENNKNIVIHLFMIEVSDQNKARFKELAHYNCRIISYDVNGAKIAKKYNLRDRHIPTCLRIFVPGLLADEDILVYLDSDIVCLSDLSPLLTTDFQNNIALVIKDDDASQQTQCSLFNIPYGKYFNAGVMFIKVKNWNKNDISSKTMLLLEQRRKEFRLLDQDALNITLNGKTILISESYNKIIGIINQQLTDNINPEDTLLHFAGPIKPWFIDTIPDVYNKYFSLSPWKLITLAHSPKENPAQYRIKAKEAFKKGHIIIGLKCYFTYLVKKIK